MMKRSKTLNGVNGVILLPDSQSVRLVSPAE